MIYNWSTIYVSDMEKSLAFYRDLLKLPVARQIGEVMDEVCVVFFW